MGQLAPHLLMALRAARVWRAARRRKTALAAHDRGSPADFFMPPRCAPAREPARLRRDTMTLMLPLSTLFALLAMMTTQSTMPNARTFLALGDSYTIGESVPESDRWPMQLARRLRDEKLELADPVIIAQTGWTTDELSAAIDAAKIDDRRFDLVTLLIGVNNQYRGRPSDEYRKEFATLLSRGVRFAGGEPKHVIVLSIPDWGVTRFAEGRDRAQIAREIDQFNAIARDEAGKVGAHYVDVTPLSREFKSEVADDGLHPSGAMYRRWAAAAIEPARSALK